MIIRIKAKNIVTQKIGELIFQSCTNSEVTDTTALNMFFRGEGESREYYLKTFILVSREVELLKSHSIDVIRDLSYFISIRERSFDVHDIRSCALTLNNHKGSCSQEIESYMFSLNVPEEEVPSQNSLIMNHYYEYNTYGFTLAISKCLEKPFVSDSAPMSYLDDSDEELTLDYTK